MNNTKIIKRGSLVTAGNYTFKKIPVEGKLPNYEMEDNYICYPVMVVEEVRNSINEDTAVIETEQVKCRWFSWKTASFRERWFEVAHLTILDEKFIKEQCADFSFKNIENYTPTINARVRLKTYTLEQYRTPEHKIYHFKSPVLIIIEIGKPNNAKNKDLVRCLWYNPAEDKYDDNLWLHPSVLIKLT